VFIGGIQKFNLLWFLVL